MIKTLPSYPEGWGLAYSLIIRKIRKGNFDIHGLSGQSCYFLPIEPIHFVARQKLVAQFISMMNGNLLLAWTYMVDFAEALPSCPHIEYWLVHVSRNRTPLLMLYCLEKRFLVLQNLWTSLEFCHSKMAAMGDQSKQTLLKLLGGSMPSIFLSWM